MVKRKTSGPRAPKSAWHYFMKRHRDDVSATHSGLKEMMREYSRLYKLAPRGELAKCQQLEHRARKKWRKELAIWNADRGSTARDGVSVGEARTAPRFEKAKPVPPMRIIHHDVQYIDREGREYTVAVPYEAAADEESDATALGEDPALSESWSGTASSSVAEAHDGGARSTTRSPRLATDNAWTPDSWLHSKARGDGERHADERFTSDDESARTGTSGVDDEPAAREANAVGALESDSFSDSESDDGSDVRTSRRQHQTLYVEL